MANKLRFRMKDLPVEERPREKLIKWGPRFLSNAELLAIILRTGSKGQRATGVAEELLWQFNGLNGLMVEVSVEELTRVSGVGVAKATQLVATGELIRRVHALKKPKEAIHSPKELVDKLMPQMRFLSQEVFSIVLLDSQNQIIAIQEISKGSANETVVHPREVFRVAVRRSSSAIILVHNHPGGSPEPSVADIEVTHRLCDAGRTMGIPVLDHLIFGDERYVSLREHGIL